MIELIERCQNKLYPRVEINNIFEIGANRGQDAAMLAKYFNVKNKNVYLFEPHPELVKYIKKYLPNMNLFDFPVSNKEEEIEFNAIKLGLSPADGVSLMGIDKYRKKDDFFTVKTKTKRMDNFIRENNIKSIDFLKLDVEGFTYEVLEGFGDGIKKIKTMHLETEHIEAWEK